MRTTSLLAFTDLPPQRLVFLTYLKSGGALLLASTTPLCKRSAIGRLSPCLTRSAFSHRRSRRRRMEAVAAIPADRARIQNCAWAAACDV